MTIKVIALLRTHKGKVKNLKYDKPIWSSESIIFPLLAINPPNYSAFFKKNSSEDISNMKKLELFIIIFTMEYPQDILVV